MHDGVLAVNADNMILFLNDSAKQMLGVATLQTGKSFEGSLLVGKIAAFMNQALKEEKSNQRYRCFGSKSTGRTYLYGLCNTHSKQ